MAKKITITFLSTFLFIGFLIPIYSVSAAKAWDARVGADMSQIKAIAEEIYDKEGSFLNVNCGHEKIGDICSDIEYSTRGNKPTIYQSENEYCAYVKLRLSEAYSCVDNSGFIMYMTYINPGQQGYCTGTTFLCPREKGVEPPPPPPSRIKIITKIIGSIAIAIGIVLGIILLIKTIFSWKRQQIDLYKMAKRGLGLFTLITILCEAGVHTNLLPEQVFLIFPFNMILSAFLLLWLPILIGKKFDTKKGIYIAAILISNLFFVFIISYLFMSPFFACC